jgi:hypothetical protein
VAGHGTAVITFGESGWLSFPCEPACYRVLHLVVLQDNYKNSGRTLSHYQDDLAVAEGELDRLVRP